MNKSKLFLLLLTPALLCGCTSRCTFKEFQDKILAIDGNSVPATTKVELFYNDGKVKDSVVVEDSIMVACEKVLTNPHQEYYSMALSSFAGAFTFGWGSGDPNMKYFIGSSGSKVIEVREGFEFTYEFNEYGHCTRYLEKTSDSKIEVKAKYTYANK